MPEDDFHTGKIIAPAPIFDNGLSLLCYAGREEIGDFAKLQEYAATRTNPYGLPFEEVCAAVMGPKQRQQLRRMIGFTFARHPSLNFSEEHLRGLERLLQIRIRNLLDVSS